MPGIETIQNLEKCCQMVARVRTCIIAHTSHKGQCKKEFELAHGMKVDYVKDGGIACIDDSVTKESCRIGEV